MREVLSKAEEVLREFHRRQRERGLETYLPQKKQPIFHQLMADEAVEGVFFCSPNACGKTYAGVAEAGAWLEGYRPWDGTIIGRPRARVLIVCEDFTHIAREDVIPLIELLIPASRIEKRETLANGTPHKWIHKNGASLKIMSYEQAPKEFEGSPWDLIIFNEPPPKAIWVPCMRGLAKRQGKWAILGTPTGPNAPWLHDEVYQPAATGRDPRRKVIKANIYTDSFLTPQALDDFIKNLDEEERAARMFGEFAHLIGRVYKDFKPEKHVLSGPARDRVLALLKDPTVPKGVVVDPHDRKPFAIAWFLVTPQNDLVFVREWPVEEFHRMKSSRNSLPDYAKLIAESESDMSPIVWRIMDPNSGPKRNVVTDSSVAEMFEQFGLYFDTRVDDAIPPGHVAVQRLLADPPKLYMLDDCRNLIHAMLSYVWDDKKQDAGRVIREKPAESGKDFADLVRYAVMYGVSYFNPADVKPLAPPLRARGCL